MAYDDPDVGGCDVAQFQGMVANCPFDGDSAIIGHECTGALSDDTETALNRPNR